MEQDSNEAGNSGLQDTTGEPGHKSEEGPPFPVADGKEVKIRVGTEYLKCQHASEILKYFCTKSVGQL